MCGRPGRRGRAPQLAGKQNAGAELKFLFLKEAELKFQKGLCVRESDFFLFSDRGQLRQLDWS